MTLLRGEMVEARRLLVRGQVQGVGFRPFVYRLARQCRLGGRVYNDPAGVCIEVEGEPGNIASFQSRLLSEAPAPARIDGFDDKPIPPTGQASFVIFFSTPAARPLVRVPRDLAVCPDCIRDVEEAINRRHGYPFTSCTACGPR